MIRTSPATIRRAAAVVLAAAVLPFLAPRASAQTSLNLFAGTIGTPAQLSVTSTLALNSNTSASGTFGVAGYSGTVSLTNGALNTLTEGFTTSGGNNVFSITQSGAATLGGTTVATKNFGPQLAPSTTYSFTLTRSAGSTAGVLGSFNISLDNGGTVFVNTATGQGLSGTVDVLGLFGSNGVATFQFTTPAGFTTANGLGVTFTGSLPANAAGGTLSFSGAAINQVVPEPHTVVAMLLGAGGLAALRLRRRLAAV